MAGLEIRVRLAHWRHEFLVQFTEDDAKTLVADNMARAMSPVVIDNVVVIGPSTVYGTALTPAREGSIEDYPLELCFHSRADRHMEIDKLPFFATHEATAEVIGDCIHLELPPAHELPWPSNRFNLTAQEWQTEIARRIASAQKAGLHKINPPSWVKRQHKREWAAAAASL